MKPSRDIAVLLSIMKVLRDPERGCPWDKQQTSTTIARYALEEAAEVVDAIARNDSDDLCRELGDLLFQVVFHAQMHSEYGNFDFGDVVYAVTEKMIRRHPHVFESTNLPLSEQEVASQWEKIKAEERKNHSKYLTSPAAGFLDSVPPMIPALGRAVALQDKAATVGFDWNNTLHVLSKIREETQEAEEAYQKGDQDNLEEEIGDILIAVTNLARHVNVDPEIALKRANAKFERRFAYIEQNLIARGDCLENASLEDMEKLWLEAKQMEAHTGGETLLVNRNT